MHPEPTISPTDRRCTVCGLVKPLIEFYQRTRKTPTAPLAYCTDCKVCRRAATRAHTLRRRTQNADRMRAAPRPHVPRTCPQCGATFTVKASATKRGNRIFCSAVCRLADYGTVEDRFWVRVDKAGPVPAHRPELGPCWLWTGASAGPMAYGVTSINRRNVYAHRYSYALVSGAIPDGLQVLHRCDVPRCVNPAHLFTGTQLDNMRDMHRKGRYRPAPKESLPDQSGERAPNTTLTDSTVLTIRVRYARGDASQAALAREFGVSASAIWRALHRWRFHPVTEAI